MNLSPHIRSSRAVLRLRCKMRQ
ncbi:hypothetical protein GQ600_8818 [Phytophthora cactorum]|nr:hypothetical protein GQ600_8818 [Phytophthora cactorum]